MELRGHLRKFMTLFHKLKKAGVRFITQPLIRSNEKYDDYKYPYSKYGLGYIDGSNMYLIMEVIIL